MFWRVYELYNLSNDEGGPSDGELLWVLYQDHIPNPTPGRLFPPLHPDEAEGLRAMRCLNTGTIARAGDVIVPHTWLKDQQLQVAPPVANGLNHSQQRSLRQLVSWRSKFQG